MKFEDIHGTTRIYHLTVGKREECRSFEISGFGVFKEDIEMEKRFRELVEKAPSIQYYCEDEVF